MMAHRHPLLVMLVLLALFSGVALSAETPLRVIAHWDTAGEPPLDDWRAMGAQEAFYYAGLPVVLGADGQPAWRSAQARDEFLTPYARLDGTGVRLIPVLNLAREKAPADELQQSRWAKPQQFRCYTASPDAMAARIQFLVSALSKHESFGGLCFDDEPGIVAGGCICARCQTQFRARYGIDAPTNTAYAQGSPGVIPTTHPILRWAQFQRDAMRDYYVQLTRSAHRVAPTLPVYLIPGAPYYSGKQLSMPQTPGEKVIASGRCLSLDDSHIRSYHLYAQFFLSRVTDIGWGAPEAAGFCTFMLDTGLPQFGNVPVYDAHLAPVNGHTVLSIPAFTRDILQTYAEGSHGLIYFPGFGLAPGHVNAARQTLDQTLLPLASRTGALHRTAGRVAILYAGTTADLADVWQTNPLERFRHLHQCDALAYYLFRAGIPFEVVLESELAAPERLTAYKVVLATGVHAITEPAAQALTAYAHGGGTLIVDATSHPALTAGRVVAFDASCYYNALIQWNPGLIDLEEQWNVLDGALGSVLPATLAICRPDSHRVNVNYLTDGARQYVFLVNDELQKPTTTTLTFDQAYTVTDVLSREKLGDGKTLKVTVPPAGMLAVQLESGE